MGAIARSAANLITTSGVVLKGAVNNDSFDNVTALPSSLGDGITLISSQTASASASISFTSGIDSTYKAYKFVFVNIHPASDDVTFTFQTSTNGGSSYGVTVTSTYPRAYHKENDTLTGLDYYGTSDLAQSTSFQPITDGTGNENDNGVSGILTLFNPSSTVFVKHFISASNTNFSESFADQLLSHSFPAGYFNTTSAINAIQFKFNTGNIDAGTIYMYGIK
jgi:hypothetical protein